MKRISTVSFLLLCALVIFSTNAFTQVLATDNFNYTIGDSLTTHGWSAHSGAGTNVQVVTTGLTYTGYIGSGIGGSSSLATNGQDVNKTWAAYPNGITSGSIYYSFLVNLDSAQTAGDYFFHFFKNFSTFPARLFAKKAFTSQNFSFGILKGSIAANIAWSDSIYSFGTTYLIVVKYSFIAGATNDTVAMWINPNVSGTEPTPTVFETSADKATADYDTVYGVAIRQGSATNAPRGKVDGIRAVMSWKSINNKLAVLSKNSIAFSNVTLGASATDSVIIKNDDATTLNISTVTSGNSVFSVLPTSAAIAAGTSKTFVVTYKPTATVTTSSAIVFSSDAASSPDSVTITGNAIAPGFTISARSHNFGNVYTNSTVVDSVTVKNAMASGNLVISAVTSSNALFTVSPTSGSLAVGDSMKFGVSFTPTAAGVVSSFIVFANNGGLTADTFKVAGNGIVKAAGFSATPKFKDYHGVLVGTSWKDSITVKNTGYDSLKITSITSSDPTFVITPTTAQIDTQATKKFYITFTPVAVGAKSASLVFTSNVSEVTDTVNAIGTGVSYSSISEVRKDLNNDLIPDHSVTLDTLIISGVVTSTNLQSLGGQTAIFIQDSTAGVEIFGYGLPPVPMVIGDSVFAIGTVYQYHGATEFEPLVLDSQHFGILKHNAVMPKPKHLTLHQYVTNAENYEGLLVEIDTLYKASGTWPATNGQGKIYVTNASKADTALLYISTSTNIGGSIEPVYPINVVAIINQFSSATTVYNDGYEIEPSDTTDITKTYIRLIIVDGLKDDFYNSLTGPSDGYLQIKYYASNDNGAPRSNADLSSKVWAAWDTTWFYLYTEVMDDTVCGNAPNVYQEDGMELKFDPQPKDSITNSIYAVGITALGMGSPGVVKADSLGNIPDSLNQKQWARRIIPGGYALEVAIKWSAIGTTEKVSVAKDSVFGMAINFHDNDSSKTRVASIEWAAVMLDAVWNTPKYLGTVKFLDNNKLSFIPKNNMTGRTNPIPYDGTPFFINVDAVRDPVYNCLTGPQDGYLQMRSYAWNDNGKPTNDADLSAKVWTAWDPTWFYLYAEVKDDTVCGNAPNVYQEDGMELKFDPQPKDSVANSIYAVGITALGMGSPGVVKADSLSGVTDSTGKRWARRIIPGGYALEIAMKWSAIGTTEKVSVAQDSVFGLAVCFHDNDSSKTRVASIEWAAVMLDAVWNTPKYLGTVKFLADNKMQFIPTNNMTPWRTNPIPYDGSNYTRVGVNETQSTIPKTFSLSQNYPNPFNPSTTIEYTLPLSSTVTIKIYSILGQEVATLINSEQAAGYYKTVWNASRLASGMYFLRVTAQSVDGRQSFTQVKKLMLMK